MATAEVVDKLGLHVLAIPVAVQGHIIPMLQYLHRLGVSSTLLLPDIDVVARNLKELELGTSIRVIGIPDSILDLEAATGDDKPLKSKMLAYLEAMDAARDGIVQFLRCLEPHNGAPPFSCVMVDLFIHSGQDIADQVGIPRIGFWTASAAMLAVNSSIPRLISEGILPSTEMDDLVIDFIPGITGLRRKNLPYSVLNVDLPYLLSRAKVMSRNREALAILGNTVYELEERCIDNISSVIGTKFIAIASPWTGNQIAACSMWDEDVHCLSWLDKQALASVIYVSFGSMVQLTSMQVEELALGLEASGVPFLWVMRPNLVSEDFFRGFSARSSNRGLVVPWAPQLKVLQHESIGGFLTHCGWNSVMDAVRTAVPMLAWPCFADQSLNCKLVVDDWKVGLRIHNGQDGILSSGEVERMVRYFMAEDVRMATKSKYAEMPSVQNNHSA